jgi:hypothetical protein
VRKGLNRIREGTAAEDIRVMETVVLTSASRVSNAEFVQGIAKGLLWPIILWKNH